MVIVDSLSKSYGTRSAVKDISFEVRPGEVLGLLGPNGAGKTTTMKIITSYMPPTAGKVSVMGHDTVRDSMAARKCIGYLPENNPLYSEMRVGSFLAFVARAKGIARSQVAGRVENVIKECGLEEVRERLIGKLSKGFRQRVGLAQALINDPPLLILDEPTMGLDPRQIYDIRQLIKDLAGSRTIILSSHILPEVNQLCDRVAIIDRGRIVAVDSTENLKARLADKTCIEVKVGAGQEDAARIVNELEGVLAVATANSCVLNIETVKDRDLRPEISRCIVEKGLPLLEIRRREMSLEEVFMQLVTEEEGEA